MILIVVAAVVSAVLANIYRQYQHQEAIALRMRHAGFDVDVEPRWWGVFHEVHALRWEPAGAIQSDGNPQTLDDTLLSQFVSLPALRTLSVSRARVGDEVLVYVSECRSLRSLDLSHTDVTDEGIHHLAGLNKLEVLDVTNTQTTDEGIERLRSSLPELEVYDD